MVDNVAAEMWTQMTGIEALVIAVGAGGLAGSKEHTKHMAEARLAVTTIRAAVAHGKYLPQSSPVDRENHAAGRPALRNSACPAR